MARKNKNAGQPNRGAQTLRRATRRQTDEWFRPYRNNDVDYDHDVPDNPVPIKGEVMTREIYLVREKVSA